MTYIVANVLCHSLLEGFLGPKNLEAHYVLIYSIPP
jgi:hypothetical protein